MHVGLSETFAVALVVATVRARPLPDCQSEALPKEAVYLSRPGFPSGSTGTFDGTNVSICHELPYGIRRVVKCSRKGRI
jgi:hypothetical protein